MRNRKGDGEPLDQEESGVVGNSLDHLFGDWSSQEEHEFLQVIEVFEQIDDSLDTQQGYSPFRDLDELAGSWSEEEAKEFQEATRDFSQVDEDLW